MSTAGSKAESGFYVPQPYDTIDKIFCSREVAFFLSVELQTLDFELVILVKLSDVTHSLCIP